MRYIKTALLLTSLLVGGWVTAAPVNINLATAEEIAESLDGIGDARAAAIVTFREQSGPFMSVEQLLEVKGIGEKILEKNRDNIVVKSTE